MRRGCTGLNLLVREHCFTEWIFRCNPVCLRFFNPNFSFLIQLHFDLQLGSSSIVLLIGEFLRFLLDRSARITSSVELVSGTSAVKKP